jgi:hypothetical protein
VDRKTIPDYSSKHKLEPAGFMVGDVIDEFEIQVKN